MAIGDFLLGRDPEGKEFLNLLEDSFRDEEDQDYEKMTLREHLIADRRTHKALLKGITVSFRKSGDNNLWLRIITGLLIVTKVLTLDNVTAAIKVLWP